MAEEKHLPERPYGALNPVPKVATLFQNIVDPSSVTKKKAKNASGEKAQEKEDSLETQQLVEDMQRGKERDVHDPVTKGTVTIKNADEDFHEQMDEKRTTGDNVLLMDFPPPDWDAFAAEAMKYSGATIGIIALSFILFPLLLHFIPFPMAPRNSFSHLIITMIPPSVISYVLLFRLHAIIKRDVVDRKWYAERLRGEKAGQDKDGDGTVVADERVKESAEWLNAFLAQLIPIANPDIFVYLVDMLEDVMQASVPSFVHSVRVSDVGLGSTPLRIISMRSLPDDNNPDAHVTEEERGTHINLEFSFAYRAAPSGGDVQSKAQNAHLLVEFFTGLKGFNAVGIPVWVEFRGAVGTARARLQLDTDPPFVKNCTVTLLGLPQIDIAATPMTQKFVNVMNLPLISTFIENSINTAAAEYVAPKHLTINLKQILAGDDIKKDTDAVGVVIIHIHRAKNIKSSDANGRSVDPYVTICFSRLSKPLFSTRIILGDLNPVFQETAFIPIDISLVKIKEKLQLQLWDSDRTSADDLLGCVEIDLIELIRDPGKAVRRSAALEGTNKGESMPGEVEFTAGFFGKMPPNSMLKTDGSDPGIPDDLKQRPEFKEARSIALSDLEAAVLITPPEPAFPSGLLSIQIHEVTDLGINKTEGSLKGSKRMGQQGQEPDVTVEETGDHLPSSYCNILINDHRVYKTRVKPISGIANFNAGTEKFISDWRTDHVTVVVRDSRNRENDPIIGLVFLKLSDVFVNASEVTRIYPLDRGIGYGRIRLSLLFRPIEAKLPPNLLGFDIGTLNVHSIRVAKVDPQYDDTLSGCKLRVGTPTSSTKISSGDTEEQDDGSMEWQTGQEPLLLPLERRFSSALVIKFQSTGLGAAAKAITGLGSSTKAAAVLWLRDLVDNDRQCVSVGIWKADEYDRIEQNYISRDGYSDTDGLPVDGDMESGRVRIGTLELDVVFLPGLSDEHSKARNTSDPRAREEQETLERMESGGLRDSIGEHPQAMESEGDDNTAVDPEATEHVERQNGASNSEGEGDTSDGEDGRKGPIQRFKEWRESEHELHTEHRGIMQREPARTVKWIKDGIKEKGHKVAERFKMQEREPDVETEA